MMQLALVFLGLSITSSWGNGHATTYRGLVRELVRRGHQVLFLERDVPYYATNRDLPSSSFGRIELYQSLDDLKDRFGREISAADAVIVGSYVPEGSAVGAWVCRTASGLRAFYDIDTPVTLRGLNEGGTPYLQPAQIRDYDLYLSFAGGPSLTRLSSEYGARAVRALYCSADPEQYYPVETELLWDLGYLGTYSSDRQPALEQLLFESARRWGSGRFVVGGPQYPLDVRWPDNVMHISHVAPPDHRVFYGAQRFTLNLTRHDMMLMGYSPSIRLFEAAASGTPILSDSWPGLQEFFQPESELVVVRSSSDVLAELKAGGEQRRRALAARARQRVLAEHTAAHRAEALEGYLLELLSNRSRARRAERTTSPAYHEQTPSYLGGES